MALNSVFTRNIESVFEQVDLQFLLIKTRLLRIYIFFFTLNFRWPVIQDGRVRKCAAMLLFLTACTFVYKLYDLGLTRDMYNKVLTITHVASIHTKGNTSRNGTNNGSHFGLSQFRSFFFSSWLVWIIEHYVYNTEQRGQYPQPFNI